jgi:hypothetical protein
MKPVLLVAALVLTAGLAAWVTPDGELSSGRNSDLPSAAEAQRCISHFDALDKNDDSVLNANELDNPRTKNADKNKDGKIRSSEYLAACATGILTASDVRG